MCSTFIQFSTLHDKTQKQSWLEYKGQLINLAGSRVRKFLHMLDIKNQFPHFEYFNATVF